MVAALLTYRRTGEERPLRDRIILMGLRIGALAVLAFCLLRPTLILKASVPQQNFVGVLVDDSRSMTIADVDSQPRSSFVQQQFTGPNAKLLEALSQRFVLRFFSFASSADRVASLGSLKYSGTATRLGPALERARDELSGLPLAGVVMVTDGADTSDSSLDEPLASLKARSIPVFPVGVGQERFSKDIQVTRVETPRTVLKGTALVVDVVLSQTGYSGRNVALNVEDEGHIVATQDVTLPADGESSTVKVRFTASDAGARLFRFRIAPQDGEQVTENNARDALIEVQRPDGKGALLRRRAAVRDEVHPPRREDDKNLEVVILQRTAENKYWRGDVTSADELVVRLPEDARGALRLPRDHPRQHRGGGVHARTAAHAGRLREQARRRTADAGRPPRVRRRRLGRHAGRRRAAGRHRRCARSRRIVLELSAQPTRAGSLFPVTQIADTEEASATKWDDMPQVSTVNPDPRRSSPARPPC